ncbi:MAG TPA: helix-turn-helix domain-containing protein [Caulobacterales bacterium]|nr:helix-turn-helix domain-containing protein [Caulobacterales bacterium]
MISAATRIRASQVAENTGLTVRAVTAMAARGDIPGAGKFGRVWTFDARSVRAWIREREQATWEKARAARELATSIGAMESLGPACKSPAATFDEAYARAIGLKPKNV